MSAPLRVPPLVARRFVRRAMLLDHPVGSTAEALTRLGYVQMDPLNVCGRMHDLILRNRVASYQEGDLLRHMYDGNGAGGCRSAFEQYLYRPGGTVLVAFPIDAWPHLLARMRRRQVAHGGYGGRLTPADERLAQQVLIEIGRRGPLSSDDIDHDERASTAWGGSGRLVKIVLEKMFLQGRVLITRRQGYRRIYDLPQRVLPPQVLQLAEPSREETARWIALLHLRQHRLATLKRDDRALVADRIEPVTVAGCPPLFCLREDLPLFAARAETEGAAASAPLLLAPLDPLIHDRRLTRNLWGFDYTWEAYTPLARRERGHYALPVLVGTELVGHVNPRADRRALRLRLPSRSIRRGHRVAPAVRQLARFLGLK